MSSESGAPRVMAAYGRTFALCCDESFFAGFRARLPPAYALTDGRPERIWTIQPEEDRWRITGEDPEHPLLQIDRETALEGLLSEVELWIAEHSRGFVFLHAGSVAVDGRAIILPGYSMAGKTTLTHALVRAGAEYFSDEYAVLDARGRVFPYRRPLSMRRPEGGTERIVVDAPDGRPWTESAEVAVVGLLTRGGEAGWEVDRLTPSEAALQLLTQTVPARARPREALAATAAVAMRATVLQGTRDEADVAAQRLLNLLSAGR